MDDNKRRKTLEQYSEDPKVKLILGEIIDKFGEIKIHRGSTHLIREILSDLDKQFNLYTSLPSEILATIFLFLSLEELLHKRTVFLVCKDWTTEIAHSQRSFYFWSKVLAQYFDIQSVKVTSKNLGEIQFYCLYRARIQNKNPSQKFNFTTNPVSITQNNNNINNNEQKNFEFENKNKKEIVVLNIEDKYNRSTASGIEVLELSSDYIIFLKKKIEFLRVSIHGVSELSPVQGSIGRIYEGDGHHLTLNMEITINEQILGRIMVSKGLGYQFIIHEKVFEKLNKMNFLGLLVEYKIIENPVKSILLNTKTKETKDVYKGDLLQISKKNNKCFTNMMTTFLSFFEIILNMKIQRKNYPEEKIEWYVWKYFDRYIGRNTDVILPNDVIVKTKNDNRINFLEFLRMKEEE